MESNEIIPNLNLHLVTERKLWNDYIATDLIP